MSSMLWLSSGIHQRHRPQQTFDHVCRRPRTSTASQTTLSVKPVQDSICVNCSLTRAPFNSRNQWRTIALHSTFSDSSVHIRPSLYSLFDSCAAAGVPLRCLGRASQPLECGGSAMDDGRSGDDCLQAKVRLNFSFCVPWLFE